MRVLAALLLPILLAAASPPPARGSEMRPTPGRPTVSPVLQATAVAMAAAWRDSDHAALAAMIRSDGAEITLGADPARQTRYTPSQAFYFFKSLFRSRRTESFRFERLQPVAGAERIHAMVAWDWRREGAADVHADRLLLVLVQEGDGWRLAEIRTLR